MDTNNNRDYYSKVLMYGKKDDKVLVTNETSFDVLWRGLCAQLKDTLYKEGAPL